MKKVTETSFKGPADSRQAPSSIQPSDAGINKDFGELCGVDLFERTQRARHLFRLRRNLANGSADALKGAKACLTFDLERCGAIYIERYEASIDAGAKSANTSTGGKQARADILRSIEADLTELAVRYEEAFATDVYR